jgi:RNA polymerase sigma factor (TIGR02999 family)
VTEGRSNVTTLLAAWQSGDQAALEELSPYIYQELRRLAGRAMAGETPGHTLQTTALVHEAFVRLVDAEVDYSGRQHFFTLAARMMRRILVDHARGKRRDKRGGGQRPASLDTAVDVADGDAISIIELDEALEKLAAHDARMAEAVELIYFGGLSYEETAETLGISRTAVFEDLTFAKAWLKNAMS